MRSLVGLADFVRGVSATSARGKAAEVVAKMCGLELAPASETPKPRLTRHAGWMEPDDETADVSVFESRTSAVAFDERRVQRVQPYRRRSVRSVIRGHDPLSRRQAPSEMQHVGLLADRDENQLLLAAASQRMPTAELDVDRAIPKLARLEPVRALPRKRIPALSGPLQVLVDIGSSMQPFYDDQRLLLARLERCVRKDAEILYFLDELSDGAGTERRRGGWLPYQPPPHRGTVLLLGDVGCGTPPRTTALRSALDLARKLQSRRSRLIVLSPLGPKSVPRTLQRMVTIIRWDRGASRRDLVRLWRAIDADVR